LQNPQGLTGLKPLQKYFVLAKKALLFLIFIFLMFFYFNNHLNLLVLSAYLIFLLLVEYKINGLLKKSIITYILLGILFFLSSKNTNLFTIESSLILLHGMPAASLMYNKKEKNHYKVIFYNIGFVVIANLLFFL